MKRLRTWLLRLLAFVVALALVAPLLWILAARPVARRIAIGRLERLGIEVVRLDVDRVGLGEAVLSAVELGPGAWLTTGTVTAAYDLRGVAAGRFETVSVADFTWTVRAGEGEIDWGLPASSGATGGLLDLAAGRIDLERGAILVVGPRGTRELSISGSITRVSAQQAAVVLTVAHERAGAEVAARLSGAGRGPLDLVADVAVATVATAAGDLVLAVSGVLDPDASAATIDIDAPTFTVAHPDQLAPLLLGDDAGDWHLGGDVAMSAHVEVTASSRDGLIEIGVANAFARSARHGVEVDEIDGFFPLGLWPTAIPEPQPVIFGSGRVGDLPITGGSALVALNTDGAFAISDLGWSMGDFGRFAAGSFTISPAAPSFAIDIAARDVSLDAWLGLLTGGRARADGTLVGELAVAYDARRRQPISFGAGQLEARPPAGWITVGGDDVRDLLEAGDPRFRDKAFAEDVGDRIVAALKDFAYTLLRIRFVPEDGDTMLRIELAGRGRTGPDPIEVGRLTLNVRGFAAYLHLAVTLGKEFRR